jgi:hypothetical protein
MTRTSGSASASSIAAASSSRSAGVMVLYSAGRQRTSERTPARSPCGPCLVEASCRPAPAAKRAAPTSVRSSARRRRRGGTRSASPVPRSDHCSYADSRSERRQRWGSVRSVRELARRHEPGPAARAGSRGPCARPVAGDAASREDHVHRMACPTRQPDRPDRRAARPVGRRRRTPRPAATEVAPERELLPAGHGEARPPR